MEDEISGEAHPFNDEEPAAEYKFNCLVCVAAGRSPIDVILRKNRSGRLQGCSTHKQVGSRFIINSVLTAERCTYFAFNMFPHGLGRKQTIVNGNFRPRLCENFIVNVLTRNSTSQIDPGSTIA